MRVVIPRSALDALSVGLDSRFLGGGGSSGGRLGERRFVSGHSALAAIGDVGAAGQDASAGSDSASQKQAEARTEKSRKVAAALHEQAKATIAIVLRARDEADSLADFSNLDLYRQQALQKDAQIDDWLVQGIALDEQNTRAIAENFTLIAGFANDALRGAGERDRAFVEALGKRAVELASGTAAAVTRAGELAAAAGENALSLAEFFAKYGIWILAALVIGPSIINVGLGARSGGAAGAASAARDELESARGKLIRAGKAAGRAARRAAVHA